jgi:Uma2 family endonuclease
MSEPARRRATYEDLRALPEGVVGELLGGELHVQPRPRASHAFTASALGIDLGGPFQRGRGGPGGWWIVDEPELHLDGDVLVPDLAGWRRERMPSAPEGVAFTVVPDWVCEVSSPSTVRIDRLRKLPIYAREGVHHVWLVDPDERTIEALALTDERWVVLGFYGDTKEARIPPFDAVPLDVDRLFER